MHGYWKKNHQSQLSQYSIVSSTINMTAANTQNDDCYNDDNDDNDDDDDEFAYRLQLAI